MAKRRLQKILDLSGAKYNSNTSFTSGNHEQNNIPNFADIISSSTIVFDENFCSGEYVDNTINSDLFIDNEVLAFPIDNSLYYSAVNNNHDESDQNILTEESENINNIEIVSENELEYNVDVITLPDQINSPTIENYIQENNNVDNIEHQLFQFVPLYNKPLPITLSKWTDLQKLKQFLPQDTHSFYDTLIHLKDLKAKTGNV